ncbi:unnamed protein product [Camellia sinensis]
MNNQSSSSSSAFSFSLSLSYKYNTACDLEANLSRECAELAAHPQHLHQNLAKLIISWISRSIAAKSTLHKLNLTTMSPYEIQKMMSEDSPQLAMELSRVENIRRYANTTQQLEAMVGDIEDAVFSDPGSRVDKTLNLLRQQVLADHRALLSSLRWPPKVFMSKIESGKISILPNPLVLMQVDKQKAYSESFLELCALQHLQTRREERQLGLLGKKKLNTGLWAIDELVSPIASRSEYHFSKWVDQPEFIFALVSKITKDFVGGVDDVSQPLIDRAKLVSLSGKEAWISVMVQTLSSFLAKQMMSFVNSEAYLFMEDSEMLEGSSRGLSVFSLFSDRPDWLKIWAKIDLKVGRMKLKEESKHERAWLVDTKNEIGSAVDTTTERFLLYSRENLKLLKLIKIISVKDDMNANSHFFGEEIKSLADLETNLLMEIIGDRLGQFEPLTKEYVQSKECFKQKEDDDGLHRASEVTYFSVSVDILEALDTLRSQLCIINASLNPKDFRICGEASQMGLTDSFLAAYSLVIIDSLRRAPVSLELICEHCLLFFCHVVFQPFSTNPEAFFPLVRNSLKLLEMDRRDLGRLNFCGVTHLSFDQADKILRNRKF